MPLPTIEDFRALVLERRPLMDVRAPVEFAKGTFPDAANLPLMDDAERRQVGIAYKHHGNEAAVALGHRLVGGAVKEARIKAWVDFVATHPEALLFCWRGGQRSHIAQTWLHEAGVTVPRVAGGYKALRAYLMHHSIRLAETKNVLILGGRTGSGKTLLLPKLPHAIDLEYLAHHRGSSFGRFATPQPTQVDFEHALAFAQIRHDADGHRNLVIEDESRNIGRCYIPDQVFGAFQRGDVVLLETPLEARITITYNEYVLAAQADYRRHHAAGTTPYNWFDVMQHNIDRIRKRLGHARHRHLTQALKRAWVHQQKTDDPTQHRIWIRELLEHYYDPMYDYQIRSKQDRIVFRGQAAAITEYLLERQ